MAPPIDSVSRRIKAIRAEKGISQTDLAQKIGVERSNYHRMENRGEKLTYEMFDKIATALGVSLLDLVADPNGVVADRVTLQQRVAELEDRLRDKQQIIESLEVGTQFVQRRIYELLFSAAFELQLAAWPYLSARDETGAYRDLFSPGSWGAEGVNQQGEAVLLLGSPKLALTADNLGQIYGHLERTNPDYFRLFTTLEHVSRLPAQSLLRRTLYVYLLERLPAEQRDRFFRES